MHACMHALHDPYQIDGCMTRAAMPCVAWSKPCCCVCILEAPAVLALLGPMRVGSGNGMATCLSSKCNLTTRRRVLLRACSLPINSALHRTCRGKYATTAPWCTATDSGRHSKRSRCMHRSMISSMNHHAMHWLRCMGIMPHACMCACDVPHAQVRFSGP